MTRIEDFISLNPEDGVGLMVLSKRQVTIVGVPEEYEECGGFCDVKFLISASDIRIQLGTKLDELERFRAAIITQGLLDESLYV